MEVPNIRRQEISAAAKVHRDLKPENILLTSKAGKRAAETGGFRA
jgi:serine/threonine protein kinase